MVEEIDYKEAEMTERDPISDLERAQLARMRQIYIKRFGYTPEEYDAWMIENYPHAEVTMEIPKHSISPKLYRTLTNYSMPIRYQIAYFAREWARKIFKFSQKNT
jgi:hypothetical protein